MHDVFSVSVFLIVFRETIETGIIVSVLLAFLKQTLDGPESDRKAFKKLRRQVFLGVVIGLLLCLVVAGALIGVFYSVGKDAWSSSEYNYEGAFALIAAVIITFMGAALLRIGKLQEKWRKKLAVSLEAPLRSTGSRRSRLKRFSERYAMFLLPFVTVLREGIEAIVFVAGVTFSAPATSVPLAVVVGLIVGIIVGYLLYKGGTSARLQIFLVISTCLLYLVAAGLFSRAVWYLETQQWNNMVGRDAAEAGAGPGSYDIHKSVWHINCCSPVLKSGGGWGILNAILGWTNSATYGSVISYNVYWICITLGFSAMRQKEVKGHWPFMKAKSQSTDSTSDSERSIEQVARGETVVVTQKTETVPGSSSG